MSALMAVTYIAVIALFLFYVPKHFAPVETVLVPVMMLSLFVLSAAMMVYFFLATPVELYVKGEREEAFRFFGKTIAAFAAITLVVVLLVFVVG